MFQLFVVSEARIIDCTKDGKEIVNFARKEMRIPSPREQQLTTLVNALNVDHIARLLTTYHHDNVDQNNPTFNMIFPKATTNLERYMRDPASGIDQIAFTSIFADRLWQQAAGIAYALNGIHTRDGEWAVHLDLKPENVLVDDESRSGQPRLMITDFGLARLRDPRRHGSGVRYGGGDEAYAPPERDGTRSYDIWSLACILLEILTYWVERDPGLRRLDAARGLDKGYHYAFWEEREGQPKIRQSIEKHMSALMSSANRAGMLSERGVRFVVQMLKLIRWMFRINKDDRPRAELVHLFIQQSMQDIWWSDRAEADGSTLADNSIRRKPVANRPTPPLVTPLPVTNRGTQFTEPRTGWEEPGRKIMRNLE